MTKFSAFVLAALAFSCVTTTASIKENPAAYAGTTISLYGTVENAITIPGNDLTGYFFQDSGEGIIILANTVRTTGQTFLVTGEVVVLGNVESGEGTARAVEDMAQLLRDKGWLDGAFLDIAAGLLVEAVKGLSALGSNVYFLVEVS
jgi:hypothetical protein